MKNSVKNKPIVLSSRLALKFANSGKLDSLREFLSEYERVTKDFVIRYWNEMNNGVKIPAMPNKELTKIDSWLSARAIQATAKQASGIANGSLVKNKRREWQASQFDKSGYHAKARKLRGIIAKNKVSCPMPERIEAQLDNRFFDFSESKSPNFDNWLTLKSLGRKKIIVPINRHIHFNKLANGSRLLNSILLSSDEVSFSFELPEITKLESGITLSIDIGQTSIFSMSSGNQIKTGDHNWTLKAINNRMATRKKGSKGFARTEKHRKNFVGQSVNRINFSGVSDLRLERIKGLKKGRRTSKSLSHWSAVNLLDALKHKASLLGVRVHEVNPMFTSQRCFCCGWVQKSNRHGERFVCMSCGNTTNADVNGSVNISLNLPLLPKAAREQGWNRIGFFWNPQGFTPPSDELIVRRAQRPQKPLRRKLKFTAKAVAKVFQ